MKTILILLLLVAITLVAPLSFAHDAIDGFSTERAEAERRWEDQFRAVPDPKSAREHLRRLTLEPQISVFLDAKAADPDALATRLKRDARVAGVRFVPREQALKELAAVQGGVGTIGGAIIGGLIIGVLNNGMSIMGIGIEWQQAVKGLVLLLAVAFDVFNKRRSGAR